jgi:hypothetical protein
MDFLSFLDYHYLPLSTTLLSAAVYRYLNILSIVFFLGNPEKEEAPKAHPFLKFRPKETSYKEGKCQSRGLK